MSHASTSPGDGLRLLSFDGGGLHCVSQALIIQDTLRRIEQDCGLPSPPRVCDYFDMICGSGFGGCKEPQSTGHHVWHSPHDRRPTGRRTSLVVQSYISENLDINKRTARYEEAVKSMVDSFVCAASSHNMAHPRLFRNYQTRANASPDCLIWQATLATTALPDVFNPIVIGRELVGEMFSSGELRWINPTDELTREASVVFDAAQHIACIVSIGSGHPLHLSLLHNSVDIFRRMASDCEKLADDLERRFVNRPDVYRRVNVQQGFQGLNRFDVVTLEQVVAHTRAYLLSAQTIFNLDSLVEDLLQRPLRVLVRAACGALPPSSQVVRSKQVPPPTPFFVGRESLLRRLYNYFFLEKDLCHIAVLYGLGGSGKTQGSLKFIQYSVQNGRFTEVFFVNASSQLTLENDLKAIAASKSLGTSMDDTISFLRNHKAEWLLFLDNADDPQLDLYPFVAWSHGNVLITSRNSEARTHAPRCSLLADSLEEDEAVSLLLFGVDQVEGQNAQQTAKEIVQKLGCLALAVNQARAYLTKQPCSLEDYLHLYQDNRRALLAYKTVQSTDDYKYSAYTTWTISFNQLSEEAALFLRLVCFMHHRNIPPTLFEDAQRHLDKYADYYEDALPRLAGNFLRRFRSQSGWDALHFHQVVGEVLSFSLLQSDPTNRSFHLHPLVQKWMQDQSEDNSGETQAIKAIISLATPHGRNMRGYLIRRALLPHLHAEQRSIFQIYRDSDLLAESCRLGEIALKECNNSVGPEHPNTLWSMADLAQTYSDLGRHAEALRLEKKIAELRKRDLGPEHPDTLTSVHNLASTYSHLGRHSEALELKEQELKLSQRVLGLEHPDTLASMDNLAQTYYALGRHSEALRLKEQVYEPKNRVSGPELPYAFMSMVNFAMIYSYFGWQLEALRVQERLAELGKCLFGPEDPRTLIAMHSLAQTYANLGRHPQALNIRTRVAELRMRIFGAEHLGTLASMQNLALTYSHLGQYSNAIDLMEKVLELRTKVLGPEHPHTLSSQRYLGDTIRKRKLKKIDMSLWGFAAILSCLLAFRNCSSSNSPRQNFTSAISLFMALSYGNRVVQSPIVSAWLIFSWVFLLLPAQSVPFFH
ncbi:hypothetical protein DL96DRAFT_1675811 [Flagelloscypha sp. PMI_526]|nr:hypothetical protein DL96DRAFT_1675811 [Flagelloscypha sp. PMI_526]